MRQAVFRIVQYRNVNEARFWSNWNSFNRPIKRWEKEYKEHKTWEALVPQYKYSSISECKTKLTDEMIDVFLKLLLHPNRFSVGKAIRLTIELLKTRGVNDIPSIPSFRRYAEHFRKYNFDKWTLLRDGEKALKDKVETYIQRDISKLEVGDVLVADGHRLNFQVINPFTGKPTRATLVGFLDWKSTALVGYEIMLEENTQCIASALRMAILNLGLVPKIVYQDNGRAFRAKYFQCGSGSESQRRKRGVFGDCSNSFLECNFDEAGFNGVYQNLGIKPVFAKPYNARAKVIERFFLEFQEEFEKLMPSYTGTSIENKPAWMNRNELLHLKLHKNNEFIISEREKSRACSGFSERAHNKGEALIPTIQQTILLLNKWIEYHNSKPCPNNREMTIQQMLGSVERQPIDVKRLDDLMMSTDVRTIHRNGIHFLGVNYFNEILYGIREQVKIRYSLFDLTKINVYSIKGEFICTAKRVEGTHPMAYHLGNIKDMEDFKQKIQKQKKLKNKTLKAVKPYLPSEDIKFLSAQIDEQIFAPPVIEAKEVKAKEKKLTPRQIQMDRPLFDCEHEKFEFLMSNGCTNAEDRTWLRNYMMSDEYIDLYGGEC